MNKLRKIQHQLSKFGTPVDHSIELEMFTNRVNNMIGKQFTIRRYGTYGDYYHYKFLSNDRVEYDESTGECVAHVYVVNYGIFGLGCQSSVTHIRVTSSSVKWFKELSYERY